MSKKFIGGNQNTKVIDLENLCQEITILESEEQDEESDF